MKNIVEESIRVFGVPFGNKSLSSFDWRRFEGRRILVKWMDDEGRQTTDLVIPKGKTNEEVIQYIIDEISK